MKTYLSIAIQIVCAMFLVYCLIMAIRGFI